MARKPQIKDEITITVDTQYGKVTLTMLLIDIINEANYVYLAYAQGRVAKIQLKVDNVWYLSKDIDILNLL